MLPSVAIHHPSAAARARLSLLLYQSFRLIECTSTEDVVDEFRAGRASALVIDGPSIAPSDTNRLLERVRVARPRAVICLYIGLMPGEVRAALSAMQAGANDVILVGHDDLSIAPRIAGLICRHPDVGDRVLQRVGTDITDSARQVIRYCLRNGHTEMSVTEVADSLGVSRGTLLNRLTNLGLAPRELIGWCRTLVAADALDAPHASLKTVAAALEFPSPAAMRNRIARYTNRRVTDLRTTGAFTLALELFAERLIA
ncbi:MAG: helix-turn-helix domain-containing protein [bacterium]